MYRLSQKKHIYTPFWFRGCTRVSLQESGWSYYPGIYTHSGNQVEWRRNPSHGSPWPFYSHASGLTLVTHGTACVPPARITLVCPPLPKPRIKHKMHMSFWNNIKILFPGLSPLGSTLSPFSHLQLLIPCPLCGCLVPLHSFIVVGLHLAVFIYFINHSAYMYIYTNTLAGSWPPTLRIPGLSTHKPTSLYKTWLTSL